MVSMAHPFWLQQFLGDGHETQFWPMKCKEMFAERLLGKEHPQSSMGATEMNTCSPTGWMREQLLLVAILQPPGRQSGEHPTGRDQKYKKEPGPW